MSTDAFTPLAHERSSTQLYKYSRRVCMNSSSVTQQRLYIIMTSTVIASLALGPMVACLVTSAVSSESVEAEIMMEEVTYLFCREQDIS